MEFNKLYNLIMEEDAKLIDESLIFSDDDVVINFDKIKNNQSNVMFIVGLSASGKSTLGKELAKKLNATFYSTDSFFDDLSSKMDGFSYEDWVKALTELKQKIQYMVQMEDKIVIEGVHLIDFIDFDKEFVKYIKNNIVIFKGTSLLKSAYRGFLRNRSSTDKNKFRKPSHQLGLIKHFFATNLNIETLLNDFKRFVFAGEKVEKLDDVLKNQ